LSGNGVYGYFDDVPEIEFRRVTDVTYHGTVNGTRVALMHMRARGFGSITNVCSAVAFHGLPLMSSYAGAKGAVVPIVKNALK
jgi:NAD(P)-dependent dehydrogenase (short-subunit alcohol dehydrogenase family)